MSAIVLARGVSLEKIKELEDEKYDLCVIINDWNREVNFDYVESFLSKQSKMYHYICREYFALLTKEIYDKFNIEKVYLNCLEKEYKGIPPYRPNRLKSVLDQIDLQSQALFHPYQIEYH